MPSEEASWSSMSSCFVKHHYFRNSNIVHSCYTIKPIRFVLLNFVFKLLYSKILLFLLRPNKLYPAVFFKNLISDVFSFESCKLHRRTGRISHIVQYQILKLKQFKFYKFSFISYKSTVQIPEFSVYIVIF